MTRRKAKETYQRGHVYFKEYDDGGNVSIRDLTAMAEDEAANFLAAILADEESY